MLFVPISLTLDNGPHTIKVRATDRDNRSQERESKFGVNTPWDGVPTPTVTPTLVPSLIPTTVVTLSVTPVVSP